MFPKTALAFNAMVVSFIFPEICFIQNLMAFLIMRFRQRSNEKKLLINDFRIFLFNLKTNYLVTNTLNFFCPLASKATILIAYIFYFLPMILAILFLSVIDPGFILCSNLRLVSKFTQFPGCRGELASHKNVANDFLETLFLYQLHFFVFMLYLIPVFILKLTFMEKSPTAK